jgi:hypothetical protein
MSGAIVTGVEVFNYRGYDCSGVPFVGYRFRVNCIKNGRQCYFESAPYPHGTLDFLKAAIDAAEVSLEKLR